MWTIEVLNQYITDKIEENLYLDYKSAASLSNTDAKKNEISKDISAFANSDGGTILYGVKEFRIGAKYLPEAIDPIDRELFSKETLEQIINSRISPRLHNVKITPIIIGDVIENKVVYAVDIPKSDTAHQASDKKYYRRFNFQSIPMDDWEIKDIINRKNRSIIEICFVPEYDESLFKTYINSRGTKLKYSVMASNRCNKVVKYCDCIIHGSKEVAKLIIPKPQIMPGSSSFQIYLTNEIEHKISLKGEEFLINTQRVPIPPFTYRKIEKIVLYSDFFIDKLTLNVTLSLDDNRTKRQFIGEQLLKTKLNLL